MLPRVTREAARRFGDATAYVAPAGWALTYRDVDRLSERVAAGLIGRGIGSGDVVALVLPPGPEYLIAYLAAAKVGAITTGVNDKLAATERDAILDIADPAIVLAAPELAPASDIPAVAVEPAAAADDVLRGLHAAGDVPDLADDPERAVAIIFTSGTTGLPKGALYTDRQLAFITANDVGDRWGGGGRNFSGTSFAHLGFMTKLPGNLMRGGTTFIMSRWRARDALELLARERMVSVAGVPTQLALMLADDAFDTFDLDAVQFIVVGGGPVTPGLAAEARARFGAALATRYSCTEAGIGLGTAFDDPDEDAIVSVGRPHPSVDLAVLDDDDAPVEAGAVGRVCLRSPAVMAGYWRDPESTRAAFTATGHVRTGDVGWLDDRGRLRLVGRSKEMYVRGGYNVYPVEVEAVLSTHPELRAVAVVPRPDPVMGEIGVAVVVADGTAPTLDGLRAFAQDRLARYKLPEAITVVDALPLTAGDKLDRRALAAMLAEAPAAHHEVPPAMELDFDTDQEDLRDSIRAFLTAECPIALVREIVETRIAGGTADASALHEHMTELGWPALGIPDAAGGLDLGPIEIALLAEELGRALTPGPLFATVTQYVPVVRALATPEQTHALLAPVAGGSTCGTVAIVEPTGAVDPAATTVRATPRGDGWELHGTKGTVFEPTADGMVVVVGRVAGSEGDDGVGAFVVPLAACAVTPIDVVDPSRVLATVTLDGVTVDAAHTLGAPGPATAASLRRALDTATVALALDAVGAAQQLFDVSLDYAKQREQFDVPIGSFQAIKHKFADLLVLLERARALGYYAALTIADGDAEQSLAAAMAKAAAGDVATRMAQEGIQIHGGIGYTWESDVHLYVRRLESDAVLFGTADHHRQRVAELIGV